MTTYLEPVVFNEAASPAPYGSAQRGKLIEQLQSVPLGRLYQASFKAQIRLQMFFTGWTHELFGGFVREARAVIVDQGGRDQMLDATAGYQAEVAILTLWGDAFKEWSNKFQQVRVEAGSIPFGVLAVFHERMVRPALVSIRAEESRPTRPAFEERVEDGVFSPQLSVLLNAASEYLYGGDSLNLSARIWRVDREARDGIANVILRGVTNSSSAWEMAKDLEEFLGANQDCPRWTSTRLYGRTKMQIAQGDTTGLVSKPCDGRGVSYNALRLARTELQKIHGLATDRIMAAQPWVEKEQVHLSEAHPEPDICDEVVAGGEGGKGIYPVGEQELPFHPNCLCYKTAVLMDEETFTSQLRGWVRGEEAWSGMDRYAELVGQGASTSPTAPLSATLLPNAINLAVWLFGDQLEKWLR